MVRTVSVLDPMTPYRGVPVGQGERDGWAADQVKNYLAEFCARMTAHEDLNYDVTLTHSGNGMIVLQVDKMRDGKFYVSQYDVTIERHRAFNYTPATGPQFEMFDPIS